MVGAIYITYAKDNKYLVVEFEKRSKEATVPDSDRVRSRDSFAAKAKAIETEYELKYGKRVVEILFRHEEEFLELQEQMYQSFERNAGRK